MKANNSKDFSHLLKAEPCLLCGTPNAELIGACMLPNVGGYSIAMEEKECMLYFRICRSCFAISSKEDILTKMITQVASGNSTYFSSKGVRKMDKEHHN